MTNGDRIMLKIKEGIPLDELEKYGFMSWNKEGAEVIYFKFISTNRMALLILNDRSIDFELPIGSVIRREDVNIENFIGDLITAGIVEKE